LKTCFKLWGNCNFSLVKTLAKIPKNWGLYKPNRKLAVRLIWQPDRLAVDRPGRPPTVRNMTVGQNRSTARSTQTNRELCSQTRSTARSTGPVPARRAQVCARRSTLRVDRLMVRSTVPVDRPSLSVTEQGQKNMLK